MAVISAQGATFTIADLLDVAQPVGGIISFTGLDGEAALKDRTTVASTAREYATGLRDGGNFSIELFREPDDIGQITALELKSAQATSTGVLSFAGGPTITFPVYVKSLTSAAAIDDDHRGTLNLKVSGMPVWS